MPSRTLFAYALGSDLDEVAELLDSRFDALLAQRAWVSKDVWVVNQRFPPESDAPGAPTEWDLGLNLALPAAKAKGTAWLDDVVAIAVALGDLHRETGRRFVIGVQEPKTGATKDLFVVDRDAPDLDALKAAFAG
jgi:hypothetical protein